MSHISFARLEHGHLNKEEAVHEGEESKKKEILVYLNRFLEHGFKEQRRLRQQLIHHQEHEHTHTTMKLNIITELKVNSIKDISNYSFLFKKKTRTCTQRNNTSPQRNRRHNFLFIKTKFNLFISNLS